MVSRYLLTAVVVLLVCAAVVSAEPSMRGYSGLLLSPTTDALADRQYNVGITSTEMSGWDARGYMVNFGFQDAIEAGALWWRPKSGQSETLLNLKYRFQPATPGRASLAVGVSDITDEMDTAVYFVASKELGRPVRSIGGAPVSMLRVHGGIGGGWINDFFFGAEVRLGRSLAVMAEHINNQINMGVRTRLWRNFTVDAGLLDMDDWALTVAYNYPLQGARRLRPAIPERPAEGAGGPAALPPKPLKPVVESTEEPAPTTLPVPVEVKPPKEEAESASVPATVLTVEPATQPTVLLAASPLVSPTVKDESREPTIGAGKPVMDIELGGLYPDSPVLKEGQIFVPVRPVADWLGFRTSARFTARGMKITVSSELDSAQLYIGRRTILVNDQQSEMPAVPYLLYSKTTMVPVEFFALLGVPIQIDAASGTILLERPDAVGRLHFGN